VNDTMEMATQIRTGLRMGSLEDFHTYISIKIWKTD